MAKLGGLDACVDPSVDEGRVAATRQRIGEPDETARAAELFRLLGDATRTRMLYALLEAGELCVCDLATAVEVSETATSHALRLLRTAGIVGKRREGRNVYYRLADTHVRLLLDVSREHLRHGKSTPR